jgi:6-pyruvoyl-tetrahydropterin synthase
MRERHKCSRLHGHNYAVDITVAGPLLNGLVVDTGELDVLVGPVIARLDHRDLNDIGASGGIAEPLQQPSVENIALYLAEALGFLRPNSTRIYEEGMKAGSDANDPPGFGWVCVRVYENDRTWAEVRAEERRTKGER